MSSNTRDVVRILAKGQATIPKDLREKFGIETPGRVRFHESEAGEIVVEPVPRPSESGADSRATSTNAARCFRNAVNSATPNARRNAREERRTPTAMTETYVFDAEPLIAYCYDDRRIAVIARPSKPDDGQ